MRGSKLAPQESLPLFGPLDLSLELLQSFVEPPISPVEDGPECEDQNPDPPAHHLPKGPNHIERRARTNALRPWPTIRLQQFMAALPKAPVILGDDFSEPLKRHAVPRLDPLDNRYRE